MRKVGLFLLILGILGNVILIQMKIENLFHDLTRVCALLGLILIVVSFFHKEKAQ